MAALARLNQVSLHISGAQVWANPPVFDYEPLRPSKYSADEWDARCKLAVGYRIANQQGWVRVFTVTLRGVVRLLSERTSFALRRRRR